MERNYYTKIGYFSHPTDIARLMYLSGVSIVEYMVKRYGEFTTTDSEPITYDEIRRTSDETIGEDGDTYIVTKDIGETLNDSFIDIYRINNPLKRWLY